MFCTDKSLTVRHIAPTMASRRMKKGSFRHGHGGPAPRPGRGCHQSKERGI